MTILATELGFMQNLMGLTALTCIVAAFALLLVDEVVKFFMRRSRQQRQPVDMSQPAMAAPAGD